MTKGSEGYERFIQLFVDTSSTLDFSEVCKDFIAFLPTPPANILDVGSGAGQNSIALAALGFKVTAVEPMQVFIDASKEANTAQPVQWIKGCLPYLSCLSVELEKFDFVLINAVWHHLNETETEQAIHQANNLRIY
ncbi:MAG: class I SAM-dependent methyltransferase [Paraglaciecola sp.]|nr:class I SAM-dependent methyltransferase [Paraglaciecola sp.]